MTSTRKFGQDKLNQAARTLDWTIRHIKDFLELGYMENEKYANQCVMITKAILELQKSINKLRSTL